MASASSVLGKADDRKMSDHLTCPICIEVFTSPRALTCLHTFCESCINTYIVKQAEKGSLTTNIQCPVCRKITSPADPSKPPAEWAENLPFNYVILPMLDSLSIESESRSKLNCGSCTAIGKTSAAVSFCKDCREYQCQACLDHHARFALMKTHKFARLDTFIQATHKHVNLGTVEYCSTHTSKEIEFYCSDHDALCCSTCAIVGHRTCGQVAEVKELGQGLKDSNKPKQLKSGMDSLQTQLGQITDGMEKNVTDNDTKAKLLPKQMKAVRDKIMKTLDSLVGQVTRDCAQLRKENNTKLTDQIFNCKSLMAAISSSCTLLESVLEHGTEAQVFITFHKLEEQVREYNKMVKELYQGASTVELYLDMGEGLTTLSPFQAKVGVRQGNRPPGVLTPSPGHGLFVSPAKGTAYKSGPAALGYYGSNYPINASKRTSQIQPPATSTYPFAMDQQQSPVSPYWNNYWSQGQTRPPSHSPLPRGPAPLDTLSYIGVSPDSGY